VYNLILKSMLGSRTKELPEFPAMCDFPEGDRYCEFPKS
jgi:hypothetical protein